MRGIQRRTHAPCRLPAEWTRTPKIQRYNNFECASGVALPVVTVEVIVDPSLVRELAYISELDISTNTLVADHVQWLTGDAAVAAAREARLEHAFAAADKWFEALGPSA